VLGATARDADGSILRVRFMAITHLTDGSQTAPYPIGTATQTPYSTPWHAVPFSIDVRYDSQVGPDEYEVWAEADDDAGATAVSFPARIRVPNWSPWSVRIVDVANELAPPATLVVVGDVDADDVMRRAAKHFGYSHRDIVSGAGHDACYLARVAPTSMIFTPCVDGVSHNESEDIKPDWATAGANVLMHAVLEKAEIVS